MLKQLRKRIRERIVEGIKKPRVPGIELTSHCRWYCKICPYGQMTRKKGNMNEYTFKLTVENILKYSMTRIISLHHFGDPLLCPELVKLINYAESKGLATRISTIGNALSPKLIDRLVNSRLSTIKFSFFGSNRKDFEDCQKASFDKTMENIDSFITKNQNTKVVIEVLTDSSLDITELPHFKKWENMVTTKKISNWTGDDEGVIAYSKVERKITHSSCSKVWVGDLKILWNGDVVPCCMDYDGKAVIGNITEQSLKQIWHGTKMNEIRKLHKEGRMKEIPLCKYCSPRNPYPNSGLVFVFILGYLPSSCITFLPRILGPRKRFIMGDYTAALNSVH